MIHEALIDLIANIESAYGVRILFISECSSRAWGFAKETSDHDLRFVFQKLPWSQKLEAETDAIRIQRENIDAQGFSVEKAMRMLSSSNLTAFEMIHSPIRYAADHISAVLFEEVLHHYYSPQVMLSSLKGFIKQVGFQTAKEIQSSFRFALMAREVFQGKQPKLSLCDYRHRHPGIVRTVCDLRNRDFLEFQKSQIHNDVLNTIKCTLDLNLEAPKRKQIDEHMQYANAVNRRLQRHLFGLDSSKPNVKIFIED